MTLADDLAALIAAREAATKGPWQGYLNGSIVAVPGDEDLEFAFSADVYGTKHREDRDAIVAAANVIEAHGAELAALVAENARLRAAAKRLSGVAADHYSAGTDEARRWADAVNEFDAEVRAALRGPS